MKETKKEMAGKKGILFSYDSLFALLLAASIIMSSLYYVSKANPTHISEEDTSLLIKSMLAMLEKKGDLRASASNTSDIELFMNSTKSQMCLNMTAYRSNMSVIFSKVKHGCSAPNTVFLNTRRAFIDENQKPCIAEIVAWYKGG